MGVITQCTCFYGFVLNIYNIQSQLKPNPNIHVLANARISPHVNELKPIYSLYHAQIQRGRGLDPPSPGKFKKFKFLKLTVKFFESPLANLNITRKSLPLPREKFSESAHECTYCILCPFIISPRSCINPKKASESYVLLLQERYFHQM